MDVQLVYATFPDEDSATELGERMLEQGLAACFTFWRAGSWYVWEGDVQQETETLALFKTAPDRREELVEAIEAGHPYDVPCVLPLASEAAAQAYTAWVAETTQAIEPD